MRLYTEAEVIAQSEPWPDGTKRVLIQMRLRTADVNPRGETEGKTEWITFTQQSLEHLCEQLVGAADAIRDWKPTEPPETVDAASPHIPLSKRN